MASVTVSSSSCGNRGTIWTGRNVGTVAHNVDSLLIHPSPSRYYHVSDFVQMEQKVKYEYIQFHS